MRRLGFVFMFLAAAIAQDPATGCREQYRKELEANSKSSLTHFNLAQCYSLESNYVGAVNEFREALRGDREPGWIIVWSYIERGKIFDITGQRQRALNEYRLAEETRDDTRGALDEVAKYKKAPYRRP
jgi:tetratricopeptide (TPR) repeat protein